LAVVVLLWLYRRRLGRGPLAAVLFFAGTLFPALGFFDVFPMRYSFVADHFQYLACVGLLALIAAAGHHLVDHLGQQGRGVAAFIGAVVLCVPVVLTWRQQQTYIDQRVLWQDTLRHNPNAWIAHTNLGCLLEKEGRPEEAMSCFHRALQLKPDAPEVLRNLALSCEDQGDVAQAMQYYRRTLEVNPRDAEARSNLGTLLAGEGKTDEAVNQFLLALKTAPDAAQIHFNLGLTLVSKGQLDEADAKFHHALDLAVTAGNEDLAQAIRQRLDLYRHQQGQPAEPAAPAPGSPP
jgi:tetratricopeptide (TPR) repeat protein